MSRSSSATRMAGDARLLATSREGSGVAISVDMMRRFMHLVCQTSTVQKLGQFRVPAPAICDNLPRALPFCHGNGRFDPADYQPSPPTRPDGATGSSEHTAGARTSTPPSRAVRVRPSTRGASTRSSSCRRQLTAECMMEQRVHCITPQPVAVIVTVRHPETAVTDHSAVRGKVRKVVMAYDNSPSREQTIATRVGAAHDCGR